MSLYLGNTNIAGTQVLYSTTGNNTDGAMTQAATTTELNLKANDTNVVHKTGNEIISGVKTIENGIFLKDIQGTIGTTTNQWAKRIQFTDSTGARIARLEPRYVDATTLEMGMYASNGLENEAGIYVRSDGSTHAPTPSAGDNSTNIATTAFVNTKFQVVSTLPASPDSNVFYFIPE